MSAIIDRPALCHPDTGFQMSREKTPDERATALAAQINAHIERGGVVEVKAFYHTTSFRIKKATPEGGMLEFKGVYFFRWVKIHADPALDTFALRFSTPKVMT